MSAVRHGVILILILTPTPGEPLYEACVTRVEKFLFKKLLKVSEAAHLDFFSLSYFYDRAVDLALLGTLVLSSHSWLSWESEQLSTDENFWKLLKYLTSNLDFQK